MEQTKQYILLHSSKHKAVVDSFVSEALRKLEFGNTFQVVLQIPKKHAILKHLKIRPYKSFDLWQF